MVQGERISVNVDTCLGCHTCELACAAAHSESKDLLKAVTRGERPGYRIYVETFRFQAVPVPCNHCEEAACVLACPTGAAHRKTEGGPVFIDDERCIGCGMCVQACPFGVAALSTVTKTAYKCDLCIERLAAGERPACVASCPTRSLSFGPGHAGAKNKREKAAEMMATAAAGGNKELMG
jgi:anaerobic carbon-monoxide dehydrogenase iron sulfur subunit